MMRRLLILSLVLLPVAGAVNARTADTIVVEEAWSRPATAGLPGVAYLSLVNRGVVEDRLTGEATPRAGAVTLHRSSMSKGVMTMTAVPEGLTLPPGQTVRLAPGGYHLMLRGVKGGLKLGERYPLTLRFAHARPETVQVEVRAGPSAMPGMKMP